MISFLLFRVNENRFGINGEQIYRIERFDPAAVEYGQESPLFYRVGDYVVSLDWLTTGQVVPSSLDTFSRLILYRSASKIRGIPVTELERVINDPELKSLALVPSFFRMGQTLSWVRLFFMHDKAIIPVVNPERLQDYSSKT